MVKAKKCFPLIFLKKFPLWNLYFYKRKNFKRIKIVNIFVFHTFRAFRLILNFPWVFRVETFHLSFGFFLGVLISFMVGAWSIVICYKFFRCFFFDVNKSWTVYLELLHFIGCFYGNACSCSSYTYLSFTLDKKCILWRLMNIVNPKNHISSLIFNSVRLYATWSS